MKLTKIPPRQRSCHTDSLPRQSGVFSIRHSERSEKSLLWFIWRLFCGRSGFGLGVAGLAAAGFAVPCGDFGATAFPTVKYLRIFSRRFGPSPRIASKSSTLLNAPYDLRICKIFSAVAGPMPGTCCNSCDVAVLMFTGFAGGFFFPASTDPEMIRPRKRIEERNRIRNRHAMRQHNVPTTFTNQQQRSTQSRLLPWA